MTYRLLIERKALKAMEKLPKAVQQRLDEALLLLCQNPYVGKRLEGEFEGAWTYRVWPYRIIYVIHQETITITVLRIGHRKDIYR